MVGIKRDNCCIALCNKKPTMESMTYLGGNTLQIVTKCCEEHYDTMADIIRELQDYWRGKETK